MPPTLWKGNRVPRRVLGHRPRSVLLTGPSPVVSQLLVVGVPRPSVDRRGWTGSSRRPGPSAAGVGVRRGPAVCCATRGAATRPGVVPDGTRASGGTQASRGAEKRPIPGRHRFPAPSAWGQTPNEAVAPHGRTLSQGPLVLALASGDPQGVRSQLCPRPAGGARPPADRPPCPQRRAALRPPIREARADVSRAHVCDWDRSPEADTDPCLIVACVAGDGPLPAPHGRLPRGRGVVGSSPLASPLLSDGDTVGSLVSRGLGGGHGVCARSSRTRRGLPRRGGRGLGVQAAPGVLGTKPTALLGASGQVPGSPPHSTWNRRTSQRC